ncbi:carbohydrate porin [Acidisarcina polymorpha]|uniref:carbohydrate porin n=1 Tax=Acidisarcina polymorpha TaxID=2211140 RepID=UPI00191C5EEF|nr:carbohydrate porin [Acidisarcina polymorpha]
MLPLPAQSSEESGLSANPGAVDIVIGTGQLGRLLGLDKTSGVHLGGVWLGDANYLISGGVEPGKSSFNSLLLLDLDLDLNKWMEIPGAQFGVVYLQFNGQTSNAQAGVVAGYNSLPGLSPLARSELYELWWRQRLFRDKLTLRVGKTVPTNDFNNVTRPLQLHDLTLSIPAVSGLIYTPVFVNPTLLGVMPGYYNSAYGITASLAPTKNVYMSYGLYDGTGARGDQTGLRAVPAFNGYFFNVGEIGYAWQLASLKMPGTFAVGAWGQTGKLSGGGKTEDGAQGFYAFASQRLWLTKPGIDNSGVTSFFQFGMNESKTLIVDKYIGGGVTGFGLVPKRPNDSLGIGAGVSRLNKNDGFRNSEAIIQGYYQIHLVGGIYFQPTLTYVPDPGKTPSLSAATAVTMRVTLLY